MYFVQRMNVTNEHDTIIAKWTEIIDPTHLTSLVASVS